MVSLVRHCTKRRGRIDGSEHPGTNRHCPALRNAAMTYPEAHEDFPWGEVAIKVSKKVFLFMHATG